MKLADFKAEAARTTIEPKLSIRAHLSKSSLEIKPAGFTGSPPPTYYTA